MPSGARDQNNVVVLQGVHYLTGEIMPVKIDDTTGGVLTVVLGVADPPAAALRENALHDDNNVPTIVLYREDGTGRACPLINNATGGLWVTT